MISAFGVDHGEFSKGLKPAHVKSMSRVMTGAARSTSGFTGTGGRQGGRAADFARARLAGNKQGAQAAVAKPGNRSRPTDSVNGFKLAHMGRVPRSEMVRNSAQERVLQGKKPYKL